jgi:uncharacterized membrane protein
MGALKDLIQGKPLGHPSHPMFVHFPIAFYSAVIAFDVMSKITPSPALVLAATYLLLGAFAGTAGAALTGLVDWWGMVKGSRKRRIATRHMLLQLTAATFFIVLFAIRWGDRHQAEAETSWIVLAAIGYAILAIGQWLGGLLVYKYAMRVSTGGAEGQGAVMPGS